MLAVLCVEDIDTLNNEDNITKLEIEHTFEFPHYVLSGFCGLVWHGTVFDKNSTGKPLNVTATVKVGMPMLYSGPVSAVSDNAIGNFYMLDSYLKPYHRQQSCVCVYVFRNWLSTITHILLLDFVAYKKFKYVFEFETYLKNQVRDRTSATKSLTK